ncbi:TetR/AcrR family transcriptional regulator [Thalassotalea euphylliae]|uniref:TetR/AcrR family transcriptional regulator n=1 Tax=Thalassotalea euphylliae TaxID=1655234 RepID=A0A3E0U247_9GAMM|nr:TetR/AcrR family transcriptional regulator [Thalassotalea euphylliae]REL30102.1 TetR/AcrR family transcriptional regulator [Thalassotalea euphylliae]
MVDARIVKSQQALVLAGLTLINKNKEISLSDIAKSAGVGRATLYRLYTSKEALIEAIALHCLQVFEQATQPIEAQATSAMHAFELLFSLAMPLTAELQFLMTLDYFADDIPEVNRIIAEQDQELWDLIEQAKQAGELDNSLPTSWVLNLIEGLFYAGWVQQEEYQASAAQAASLAFRSFSKAVQP